MIERNTATPGWGARIRARDRRAIARAITAIENGLDEARPLLADLLALTGHAHVIGITGPPGAGKSTLVNAIVREALSRNRTVAVVAVDPSSPISGGAVLGDRVRMADVHDDERVFIRSLAARGHLGGLTRTTRDVVDVLDAAGFDDVIVETVGAGQSEVEIASIASTRVVVCPPGLGDDVQALKAGILEIADILVVNKADLAGAEQCEQELRAMIALRGVGGKRPPVIPVVATTASGVARLYDAIVQRAEESREAAKSSARVSAVPSPSPLDSNAGSAFRLSDPALLLERRLAARDNYMAHLGAMLVDGGSGRATVSMQVRREHLNFLGSCHGGALFSLADMALGLACNSQGTVAALIDAHSMFPTAVVEGDSLVARAVEVHRTRRLGRYRIEVTRGDEVVMTMQATVVLTGREMTA